MTTPRHQTVEAASSTSPNRAKPGMYDSAPIDFSTILFAAKIDFVKIQTPGSRELPVFDGIAKWGVKEHYKTLTVHDATARDVRSLLSIFTAAKLIEMEVAVDLQPKAGLILSDRTAMLERLMLDVFARKLEPSSGVGMVQDRYYRSFYQPKKFGNNNPFHRRAPAPYAQLLYGTKYEPVQVKSYLKTSDQKMPLPECTWVARVEVRIESVLAMHGLHTIEDLPGFQFRKNLMPYFRHMKRAMVVPSKRVGDLYADIGTKGLQRNNDDHWEQAGVGAFLDGRGFGSRNRLRFTRDIEINNRIGQALLRLERQHASGISCGTGIYP